ncbi:MAG: hypothetical protein SGJ10_12890 [Bacteroidota bacterium]|nr:hypothetical protein [Bacteroidota bacterium]
MCAYKFIYEILSQVEEEDGDTTDYKKQVKLLEKMYMEELKPFGEKGYQKKPNL